MRLFITLILPLMTTLGLSSGKSDHSIDHHKKLVLSVFKALEEGNLALLNKVFDPEGRSIIGSEERKRGGPFKTFAGAAPFPAALDDRDVKVESIFSEGNRVAVQSKICGIHARELVGYKPTNKKICARYTNLYTIRGGRIIENVVGFDPQLRKNLDSHQQISKR